MIYHAVYASGLSGVLAPSGELQHLNRQNLNPWHQFCCVGSNPATATKLRGDFIVPDLHNIVLRGSILCCVNVYRIPALYQATQPEEFTAAGNSCVLCMIAGGTPNKAEMPLLTHQRG